MKKDHYTIVLPVNGTLSILVAVAKKINGKVIIKSLSQALGMGLPSIDRIKLLDNGAYESTAIDQIAEKINRLGSI